MKLKDLFFFVFCVIFVISCKNNIAVNPDNIEIQPELTLVPMNGGLKKVTITESSINFGDIVSTKTLLYLLVNKGNTSAFDIHLNSGQLLIEPNYFDIIPSESNSSTFLPIIKFIFPHVLSPDNVGVLWDFSVGPQLDTLLLSYKYIGNSGDTSSFTDIYPVTGNKQGVIINYYMMGQDVRDITEGHNWMSRTGAAGTVSLLTFYGWSMYTYDDTYFINEGNVPIDVEIIRFTEASVYKTILSPGDSLDLKGYFPSAYAVFGPTKYIINLCGQTVIDGVCAIHGG